MRIKCDLFALFRVLSNYSNKRWYLDMCQSTRCIAGKCSKNIKWQPWWLPQSIHLLSTWPLRGLGQQNKLGALTKRELKSINYQCCHTFIWFAIPQFTKYICRGYSPSWKLMHWSPCRRGRGRWQSRSPRVDGDGTSAARS